MKKKSTVLLYKCLWFRAKHIDQRCTSYKFKTKLLESWFLSYEERYTYYEFKNLKKRVNDTVQLFTLYSIWVHVEVPKYKMICLNSPNSCEFAKTNTVKNP